MGPQQAGFTVNYPHLLDEQSRHVAYIVSQATLRGVATLEASEAAEAEWVETILRLSGRGREFLESCTPGYYNNEGRLSDRAAQNGFFGGGSVEFFRLLREWRERGDLAGLDLHP
jgi:cyclohexanone monooxygenase